MSANISYFKKTLEDMKKHQEKTCDELKDILKGQHKQDLAITKFDEKLSNHLSNIEKEENKAQKKKENNWKRIAVIFGGIGALGTLIGILAIFDLL